MNGVKNFSQYLVKTYASIMTIVLLSVLIKLRFKMDIGAMLILFGYTISMIFRISQLADRAGWISTAAELIVWISLFSFLFQMKLIKDKLTSESVQDFHAKLRSTKIQIFFILFCYVFFVYGIEFYTKDNTNWQAVNILLIIRIFFKLIADAYCFVAFMQVFRFFIQKKMDANKMNRKQQLSPLNKFAVGYTISQYVL